MTTNQETVVNCPCLSLLIFLLHILLPDLEQILVSIYLSTCTVKNIQKNQQIASRKDLNHDICKPNCIQFTTKVLKDLNKKNTHFLYKELDLNLKMSKEGECGTWTIKTFGNTTNSYLWTKKTLMSVFSKSQNGPPELSTPVCEKDGEITKNREGGGGRERKRGMGWVR